MICNKYKIKKHKSKFYRRLWRHILVSLNYIPYVLGLTTNIDHHFVKACFDRMNFF